MTEAVFKKAEREVIKRKQATMKAIQTRRNKEKST